MLPSTPTAKRSQRDGDTLSNVNQQPVTPLSVNSQNGHSAATYHNSGRVTQANIAATLPGPGTYYLFFNNKFSMMTPKAVVANATVNYNTVERR